MISQKKACLLSLLIVAAAMRVTATPIGVAFGTSAPDSALGGYDMSSFQNDSRTTGASVSDVAPPASFLGTGKVRFSEDLVHYNVTGGSSAWASWSHGYRGDVYHLDVFFADPSETSRTLVLTLPDATNAFSFYLEPGFFGGFVFDITATDAAGETVSFVAQTFYGSGGASGFGFYSDIASQSLATISITGNGTWPDGFAVGEFGINGTYSPHTVPDASVTALLVAGAFAMLALVRRCKK